MLYLGAVTASRGQGVAASTIPIIYIKVVVDNLAVWFKVFPRDFMILLLVSVLSCCLSPRITSSY